MRLDSSIGMVAADWTAAAEPLRSVFALIREVASTHEVPAEPVRRLLAQGVPREALIDVFHVMFLFSGINRVADTLGFDATFAQRQSGLLKLFQYYFLPQQAVPAWLRRGLHRKRSAGSVWEGSTAS